jgi:hypothetical protein
MNERIVIDNFLPKEEYEKIHNVLGGEHFPWYYADHVSDIGKDFPLSFYFVHTFFIKSNNNSNHSNVIQPILNILEPKSILRIKANFYPRTDKILKHGYHCDQNFDVKSALYFVNSNDGVTTFEDTGEEIKSVANRMLFFNSHHSHCSSTCTNQRGRITINFNYF